MGSELSTPSSDIVEWRCTRTRTYGANIRNVEMCHVSARTWYQARQLGAATLQCEPGQLSVERA